MPVDRNQEIRDILELLSDADFSSAHQGLRTNICYDQANKLREQADG